MAKSVLKVEVRIEEVVVEPPTHRPPQWREYTHNFSWQWHVIVMATGDWSKLLTDPAKSLFIGFFTNGAATLLNAGLSAYNDWGLGGGAFLYVLWGLWWLDCILSCAIAFGLVYIMMGQNSRDMSKVGPVWMVPIITMITISASGSQFTRALLPHSHTLALLSLAISTTMLLIGLSFTMMFTTAFLLRLYLYGPLDSKTVFTTFTALTPLGQGGYSMLLNGRDLADVLPYGIRSEIPENPLIGKILYTICFCGSYMLWSMGLAWIALACFSIIRRAHTLPPFCITHWCVIVPNGVFASLSVQLATVLNSPFFRAFGAIWSCLAISLWVVIFLRTIPALINGSIFRPTNAAQKDADQELAKTSEPPTDEEKSCGSKALEVLKDHDTCTDSVSDTLCSVKASDA
ncbi:hypothetical protein NM688_g1158 [Phlebia brevispora]|uniref:Uncharacterized protein n=1 Tax=Phlebia brevispora TaxID=194682 RepID=A0ACC1TCH6_9APHY|nr:hypothetical protein NM688_g1158 [Phlebia brevispora]